MRKAIGTHVAILRAVLLPFIALLAACQAWRTAPMATPTPDPTATPTMRVITVVITTIPHLTATPVRLPAPLEACLHQAVSQDISQRGFPDKDEREMVNWWFYPAFGGRYRVVLTVRGEVGPAAIATRAAGCKPGEVVQATRWSDVIWYYDVAAEGDQCTILSRERRPQVDEPRGVLVIACAGTPVPSPRP